MSNISVIISVYNRVHLLRKGLISLLNQSIQPNELIISDDGSSEDILNGISDITKKCSFPVKYISQSNEGFRLAKVRNNGVRISNGDFLIFLDQDIIYTRDFLETFVNHRKEKRFLTSYPIRLNKVQSEKVSESSINKFDFLNVVTPSQKFKIINQYIKDYISFAGEKIGLVKQKPKLRGGVCAINRKDYYLVNGYDEMFRGWGNEDDDIRKRLYNAGVSGFNPFFYEYPLHLYHEPFHENGKRANQDYVIQKSKKIKSGIFTCEFGVKNPIESDREIIELK